MYERTSHHTQQGKRDIKEPVRVMGGPTPLGYFNKNTTKPGGGGGGKEGICEPGGRLPQAPPVATPLAVAKPLLFCHRCRLCAHDLKLEGGGTD